LFYNETPFVFHIYLIFTILYNYRSVQKVENGAYLKVNNEEISLSNVFENPGQPEEHTVEGVRLQLVFRDAGRSGFTENAGAGKTKK